MSDKILQEIANALETGLDTNPEVEVRFDVETHNMLFGALDDIAVQLKRIAEKMEAGQ